MSRIIYMTIIFSVLYAFSWMTTEGFRIATIHGTVSASSIASCQSITSNNWILNRSMGVLLAGKNVEDEMKSGDEEHANLQDEVVGDVLADSDEPEVDPNAELKAEIERLEKEFLLAERRLNDARESIKEKGKTGYLLLAAEVDNYRKRRTSDRDSLAETAMVNVLRTFMPIFDRFRNAENVLTLETENEIKFNSNYQALYRQLEVACTKLGVSDYYGVQGESYSAAMHDKVGEEYATLRSGAVLECVEKGRKMKSGIIQKAKVIISLGPEPENEQPEKNEGKEVSAELQTKEA